MSQTYIDILKTNKLTKNQCIVYMYMYEEWFKSLQTEDLYHVSQEYIADQLDMHQPTVSNVIQALSEKGLVSPTKTRLFNNTHGYTVTPPKAAIDILRRYH